MTTLLPWFAYALTGLFAGLLAGLLGVGGGLIIVPVFVALFSLQGFSPDHLVQLALGSSLASIVFTSLSSTWAHQRRAAVDWVLVVQLSLGLLAGAWTGGQLAKWLGGSLLSLLFGVFELAVAVQMFAGRPPSPHRRRPGGARNALAGVVIGILSALLGIGGGTLTVPWLVWHGVGMRTAVATSAACGLPIALSGALGFVLAGRQESGLPAGSTGYLYWPAVAAVSAASVVGAPLGARLAHWLDPLRLKRLFAGFIALLGVGMVARVLSG
ncbi:MAG TPA: sulfite exporter TauE/SafE family protein [Gammaproteobacteria bacterium]|nr:sulfite exporter TauE/SafE family protein [Gammaproteobacteria bacterium]